MQSAIGFGECRLYQEFVAWAVLGTDVEAPNMLFVHLTRSMEEGIQAIGVKACGQRNFTTGFREPGCPQKRREGRIVKRYQKWGEQQGGAGPSFVRQSFLLLQSALALCGHGTDDVVLLPLGPNPAQLLNQAAAGGGAGAVVRCSRLQVMDA